MRDTIRYCILIFYICSAVFVYGQNNAGEVRFYIFSQSGSSLSDVEIRDDDNTVWKTDDSGYVSFYTPVGEREFSIVFEGSIVAIMDVEITSEYPAELIVTVNTEKLTGQSIEDETRSDLLNLTADRNEIDDTLPKGRLSGKIIHIESEEPVPDATVIFRGINLETVTDKKGNFYVDVPEGTYSISVIHPQYSTRTVNEISVAADNETSVSVLLTPSAITLETVQVFATTEVRVQGGVATLIEETKNAGVMLNLIGAEQISKSGDSDAAAALKRVTGLTILDGKYVFVRGMGDRYSSSYLNGARIPSPEVGKRVVPLDLFPTSVIEAMAVQKTYSPNMYGDFGGGAVSLRTTGIPDDRYKRRLRQVYSFSLGYDMNESFTEKLVSGNTLLSHDYITTYTGFDNGSRDLPDDIESQVMDVETLTSPGFTTEEIAEIGKIMPEIKSPESRVIPLDYSGSISLRDKIDFKNTQNSFGWNLSMLYRNDWNTKEESLMDFEYSGDQRVVYYDYDSVNTSNNIDLGGLLNLEYKMGRKFDIESTTLLIHTSEEQTHSYNGYKKDLDDIKAIDISWIEQSLINQQLRSVIGLDFLNHSLLNIAYSYSNARHNEPDHYKYMYTEDPGAENGYSVKASGQSIGLVWGGVNDQIHDATANIEIPFSLFARNTIENYADIGTQFIRQDRITDMRRFAYIPNSAAEGEIEDILSDDNIGESVSFREFTKKSDSFLGSHTVAAGYFNLDLLLFSFLRCTGGLRYEYSNQSIETYDLENSNLYLTDSLVYNDFLPSVNFNITFDKSQQLRLGVSKTVNRPDLKEISYVPTYGIEGSPITIGYPGLVEAEIWNADARYEYYITENENLSFGVFYKNFANPIEAAFLPGESNYSVLTNVPSAYNLGAELEWRLSLRYFSDALRWTVKKTRPSPPARKIIGGVAGVFRDLSTSGNLSYIQSRVSFNEDSTVIFRNSEYPLTNTSAERPLQGQSPWVINLSLEYKNIVSWSVDRKTHTSCNLNYNVIGPRITAVGVDGTPDYYEEPFHQLDLVMKHSFNEVFSIGIKAKNILDLPAVETLDGEEISRYRKGRSFSISAKFEL